jgi:hypothetical protein
LRFQSSRELAGLLDRRRPQARRALWNQFEQRMDIVLTYWHWLEYDSVALATLFSGIGLVALLVLSI